MKTPLNRAWCPYSSRRAFTLPELLIVVAIIALLAAILFPVFGRARDNARRTSCLSNLRQIGLAFTQYTQDYDECYPLSSYPSDNISWTTGAAPYLKSTQIFRCSSDTTAVLDAPAAPPFSNYYTTSYLMNAYMAGTNPYTRLSSIQSPSKVVLLTESAGVGRDHFHPFNWVTETPTNPLYSGYMHGITFDDTNNQTREFSLARHLDGFNLAYCDGHAKWTKWTMVWPPQTGGPLEGVFDPRQ